MSLRRPVTCRYQTQDEAEAFLGHLLRQGALRGNAGVVEVLPNGTTEWRKTLNQELLEARDKLKESAGSNYVPIHDLVREAVARYKNAGYPLTGDIEFDILLVESQIDQESSRNLNARSSKGALGLMQVLPGTFREEHMGKGFTSRYHEAGSHRLMRFVPGKTIVPHQCFMMLDPAQNIDAGVHYMAKIFHENPNASLRTKLRIYNAGKKNVQTGRNIGKQNLSYAPKIEQKMYQRVRSGRLFTKIRTLFGRGGD